MTNRHKGALCSSAHRSSAARSKDEEKCSFHAAEGLITRTTLETRPVGESAVMASVGIILYIGELAINSYYYDNYVFHFRKKLSARCEPKYLPTCLGGPESGWKRTVDDSLLEFCITVSTAHFRCQATCCNSKPELMVFVPYQVSDNMADSAENNLLPPPDYNSVDSAFKAV